MTIPGSIGTGPVVDKDGKPLRAIDPFDARAEDPSARVSDGDVRDHAVHDDDVPTDTGNGAREDDPSLVRRSSDPLARGWVRGALGAVVPLLALLVWHLTTTSGLIPPHRLPSPQSVVLAAAELLGRGELLGFVHISVQRVLIGFVIGAVIGLVIGAVVGLSRLGDALLSTTFSGLRAVPSLAWIPLLIIWLQYGEESKITLVAIGAFFPVYTTVASALRHVDPHLVEAGRAYGLRGAALLGRVQLPAATPAVVSGLRLALAQAWLFLVAAELLGASKGLGFLLTDSQNNGRVDRILLAIVLLAVLGKTTDALIGLAEKRLARRW